MTSSIKNKLRERINAEREAARAVEHYVDCDLVRVVKNNASGAVRAYADALRMIEEEEEEEEAETIGFVVE